MLTFTLNKKEDVYRAYEELALIERPESAEGCEWYGLVWENLLRGKFDKSKKVSVDAYGKKCEENMRLNYESRYTSLLTGEELEEGGLGVSDVIASYIDENIESIIESSDIERVCEEVLDMRDYVIRENEVDMLYLIEKAREGSKKCAKRLKELMCSYMQLEEKVEKIVQEDRYYEKLKGMVV